MTPKIVSNENNNEKKIIISVQTNPYNLDSFCEFHFST